MEQLQKELIGQIKLFCQDKINDKQFNCNVINILQNNNRCLESEHIQKIANLIISF